MLDPRTLDERIRTIEINPPEKREIVEASVRRQRRLHDTGRRPRAAGTQPARATRETGHGAKEETQEREEVAKRIHHQRSKHHDPAVRADAHLQLAALAPNADSAAQILDEVVANDTAIATDLVLARRLAERVADTRRAGRCGAKRRSQRSRTSSCTPKPAKPPNTGHQRPSDPGRKAAASATKTRQANCRCMDRLPKSDRAQMRGIVAIVVGAIVGTRRESG